MTCTPTERVRLIRRRFLNRTDRLCHIASWGKPCPIEGGDNLDNALLAHLLGEEAPAVKVRWVTKGGKSGYTTGRFRLGGYLATPTGCVICAVVDCDGGGRHGHPLADPLDAALRIVEALRKHGIVAHLECSGSGTGWHVWVFFNVPVPAAKVRRLLFALVPKDALLKNKDEDGKEQYADASSNRGLEVFPKQEATGAGEGKVGSQVWLPWWSGAAEGGNLFYRIGPGGEVAPYDPEDFETTTEADLDRALATLPAPKAKAARTTFTYEGAAATDREKALSALAGLKPGRADAYDEWLHVGMALHSVDDSPAMLDAWDRWSQGCQDKYEAGACAEKWAGFKAGGGKTLGTLIYMAQQDGWSHGPKVRFTTGAKPSTNGDGAAHDAEPPPSAEKPKGADGWTEPIPFDAGHDLPEFPTHLLPSVLCEWVAAEAGATQTPAALAASLSLSICGAALATKFRVVVRDGWTEPANIFTVVALLPGERKSAVFRDAMAPVGQFEKEEQERMASVIAEAASEHRTMEARLKLTEQRAAKAEEPEERQQLRHEAKELAKELAAHVVPESPQMYCDDETPESLCRLIAKQGGRMLQASAEGTAFEIVKGRYSESPNFDVYLKGHAGDPLRVGRVGRDRDVVDHPALSVALAVQPDVIQGLAEQAILRGRGFLARFLYGLPVSRVGSRITAPQPVPRRTEAAYHEMVLHLWRLEGAVEEGKPAAHLLRFSPAADHRLQDFERWLEPQMAEGEELSLLAGWAQKLAGAAAHIAGILHVTESVAEGRPWQIPINEQIVGSAVALARDYFLPHAQAAFAVMGADAKVANARHVWASIARRRSEFSECSENGGPCLSRRDIHQQNRRRFPNVEDLDPVLALLVDRYYLRPVGGAGQPGRGHSSPSYQVNPLALATFVNAPPRTHCTQRTHSNAEPPPSEFSENSESAPPRSDGESGGYCAPGYEDVQNPFTDEEGVNP